MGAMGWAGLGQAGEASSRKQCPGPPGQDLQGDNRGRQTTGLLGALATGAKRSLSAPPQLLQLVGHFPAPLDGRQALQLLVLGENPQSHPGAGVWSAQSAWWLLAQLCDLGCVVLPL